LYNKIIANFQQRDNNLAVNRKTHSLSALSGFPFFNNDGRVWPGGDEWQKSVHGI